MTVTVTAAARERIVGLAAAVCGLVFALLVIPQQTETVTYGSLSPGDVPLGAAWMMTAFGAVQMLWPRGRADFSAVKLRRAGLLLGLCAGAVILMEWRGFVTAAPLLALAVMLQVGERRIGWLAVGVAAVPAAIWAAVTIVLARPLP